MGLKSVAEEARGQKTKTLYTLKDKVSLEAPGLRPGPDGRRRFLAEILSMAEREPVGYALLLKYLLDQAKQFLDASHGAVSPTMEDAAIARLVCYNSGAWQALVMAANFLDRETLGKNLDALS